MLTRNEHCAPCVENQVKFPVLQGRGLPLACLALDGDEVSVHTANDVRYPRTTEAVSRGHEVVYAQLIKQKPHRLLHFPFRCSRHNSSHS